MSAGNFFADGRCLCSAARWRHWLPYGKSRGGNSRYSVHVTSPPHAQVRRTRSRLVLWLCWLQAPNASARCTRRGAYVGNFCAKGRCLYSAARWRHWLPYERNRNGNGQLRMHDVCSQMAESGDLAFPACPSASWLQAPNASACCTRKGGVCGGLLVLAGPVPEPHCWCSRPGGGTLEVGGAATTGTTPTWSLLFQREVWATDLGSPAWMHVHVFSRKF